MQFFKEVCVGLLLEPWRIKREDGFSYLYSKWVFIILGFVVVVYGRILGLGNELSMAVLQLEEHMLLGCLNVLGNLL